MKLRRLLLRCVVEAILIDMKRVAFARGSHVIPSFASADNKIRNADCAKSAISVTAALREEHKSITTRATKPNRQTTERGTRKNRSATRQRPHAGDRRNPARHLFASRI